MSDDTYELHLAFDTDDPEFARGFEAGVVYGQMQHLSRVEQTIGVRNIEMVMRMAEAGGWTFTALHGDDPDWVTIQMKDKSQ